MNNDFKSFEMKNSYCNIFSLSFSVSCCMKYIYIITYKFFSLSRTYASGFLPCPLLQIGHPSNFWLTSEILREQVLWAFLDRKSKIISVLANIHFDNL